MLEGSSLGAQLLLRRAITLGLDAQFGARHLAVQVNDPRRWSRFIALLECVPQHLHAQALVGAQRAFAHALAIYMDANDDRA